MNQEWLDNLDSPRCQLPHFQNLRRGALWYENKYRHHRIIIRFREMWGDRIIQATNLGALTSVSPTVQHRSCLSDLVKLNASYGTATEMDVSCVCSKSLMLEEVWAIKKPGPRGLRRVKFVLRQDIAAPTQETSVKIYPQWGVRLISLNHLPRELRDSIEFLRGSSPACAQNGLKSDQRIRVRDCTREQMGSKPWLQLIH